VEDILRPAGRRSPRIGWREVAMRIRSIRERTVAISRYADRFGHVRHLRAPVSLGDEDPRSGVEEILEAVLGRPTGHLGHIILTDPVSQ
jgi:hypothetical protein